MPAPNNPQLAVLRQWVEKAERRCINRPIIEEEQLGQNSF